MSRGQYTRRQPAVDGISTPQSADNIDTQAAESPREAETQQRRRRRDGGNIDGMGRLNLAIPSYIDAQAKREGKVTRWFIDKPGRIAGAVADDWDPVPGVDPVSAGQSTEQKHVLYWKLADWHESDEREELDLLRQREVAINAGHTENRQAGDGLVLPRNAVNRTTFEKGL